MYFVRGTLHQSVCMKHDLRCHGVYRLFMEAERVLRALSAGGDSRVFNDNLNDTYVKIMIMEKRLAQLEDPRNSLAVVNSWNG